MNEEASSNYGKESTEAVEKHKEKYYSAAPKLFHVQGKRGTSQSPVNMARKHKHTFLSESFSVGALAKKYITTTQLQSCSNVAQIQIAQRCGLN